ncbi:MAG: hypothetical protein SF029_07080 [bacterium]|nr:hypothetical protein [bacterium]
MPTRVIIVAFIALFCAVLFPASEVRAEGSRTYHPQGAPGNRAWLEYITGGPLWLTAGIARLSVIHVYAVEGETIYLGSSAVGVGQGFIYYVQPDGQANSCLAAGLIANRVQELAGPQPLNPAGYVPCVVVVPPGQTGIWNIHFVSPNPQGGAVNNPPVIEANAPWVQNDPTRQATAAWDVTVVNVAGQEVIGRVYTDYLAMNMGGLGSLINPVALDSLFYILTNDGYLYSVDLNRMNPFGFIFFGNNKGFQDAAGQRLYRSVQLQNDNDPALLPGEFVHNPDLADDGANITHKIFFHIPSPDLPASAMGFDRNTQTSSLEWLRTPAPFVPGPPTNFAFVGAGGIPGITLPGQGGRFEFDLPLGYSGGYTISLDLNNDGDFADDIDRVLFGNAAPGTRNVLVWDGLDGEGTPVAPTAFQYEAEVSINTGEVHFPFLDVEANPRGLIIAQLSDVLGTLPVNYTVYYNDEALLPGPGQVRSDPPEALQGIDSLNGAHEFGTTNNLVNAYGNIKGIDTWVYRPGPPVRLPGGITILSQDLDLAITKVDLRDPLQINQEVEYVITVANVGATNAVGATVVDEFGDFLFEPRWTCAASGGATCAASGTGDINDTVNLPVGGQLVYSVRALVSEWTPNPFPNVAVVNPPPGQIDINMSNNQDDEVTNLIDRPLSTPTPLPPGGGTGTGTGISSSGVIRKGVEPPFVQPGDAAAYTITITNTTGTPLSNLVMTDNLPTDLRVLSAAATAGNVTVNGQQVRHEIALLNPGESVIVTVRVQVSPEVRLPIQIRNQACVNLSPEQCASALLLGVTRLPETGETPWWRGVMLVGLIGMMLLGVIVMLVVGMAVTGKPAEQ